MIKRYVFSFFGFPKSANTDTYYPKLYLSLGACKAGASAYIRSNHVQEGRFAIYEVDMDMTHTLVMERHYSPENDTKWIKL